MEVNGILRAGEVLLQWWLPRGFNFWLMDYPLGSNITPANGISSGAVLSVGLTN